MSNRMQIALVGLVFFLLGCLLAPQVPQALGQGAKSKAPVWSHALTLGCRKFNEEDWDKNTRKFGIEAFKDENTGNLIYITETGSIAVVPHK